MSKPDSLLELWNRLQQETKQIELHWLGVQQPNAYTLLLRVGLWAEARWVQYQGKTLQEVLEHGIQRIEESKALAQ